jgi:Helix-turn-helix domain
MDRFSFDARAIPCPRGLHRATYRRLLRDLRRVDDRLARLRWRPLRSRIRHRLETLLRHRLLRIRERLGLEPSRSPGREWVRVGSAAAFLHVSTRTLCRWTNQDKIAYHRAWSGGHRYFQRRELLRVRATRRV